MENMRQDRKRTLQTLGAMAAALLLLALLSRRAEFAGGALAVLGLAFFFKEAAARFAAAWMKIAGAIAGAAAALALGAVYYLLLTPLALAYRLFRPGRAAAAGSYFHAREHSYSARDLENPW
ncbi:MAG TPA: hypothetical protein DEQ38_00895 [Elusimicrobia bacterium]|nr:MAG: hypothetical protein A2089_09930 [Elusimicrobia bacterium GWD2_63_28]HCC46668.1 hypothetical protein [Elusimicrobiota bacterium]